MPRNLTIAIDEQQVISRAILVVSVSTPYKIRKWIAMKLIILAVWVLGCRVEFVEAETEQLT